MMRIGILSDTHDQVARTARADALFHCGDLTGPEVVAVCGRLPGYYVFGNNDSEEDLLRLAIARAGGTCLGRGGELVLDGRRVAMTHGDSPRDVRRLLALEPDY